MEQIVKTICLLLCLIITACASNVHNSEYLFADMELQIQDDFLKSNTKIEPGVACGQFKKSIKGCFKLIVEDESRKASQLIYTDSKGQVLIKKFTPSINFIYLTKRKEQAINTSKSLVEDKRYVLKKWQEAVELHYYEKSTVVYYWDGTKFDNIWVSD